MSQAASWPAVSAGRSPWSRVSDSLGRLTTQSVTGAGGRAIQSRTYTYRADGNLIGIDDQLSGSRRFGLDAAGRVTAVHAGLSRRARLRHCRCGNSRGRRAYRCQQLRSGYDAGVDGIQAALGREPPAHLLH
jgi:YD repeat-containing protein